LVDAAQLAFPNHHCNGVKHACDCQTIFDKMNLHSRTLQGRISIPKTTFQ